MDKEALVAVLAAPCPHGVEARLANSVRSAVTFSFQAGSWTPALPERLRARK